MCRALYFKGFFHARLDNVNLLAVPHAHQVKIFEYPQNEKKAILYLQKE
jgi:hypothetical protein